MKVIEDRKRKQGKSFEEDEKEGDYEIIQREIEKEIMVKKRKLDFVVEISKGGRKKKEGFNKKFFFVRIFLIKSIFLGGYDDDDED